MGAKAPNPCPFPRDAAKPPASPAPPPPKPVVSFPASVVPATVATALLEQAMIDSNVVFKALADDRDRAVQKPVEQTDPPFAFADAETALRALLESGCDTFDRLEDFVCFHCKAELHCHSHEPDCRYIAAKAFVESLSGDAG